MHFKSKYITDELVRIFTEDTDTEDEEFEGFDEEDCSWISDGIKCMVTSTNQTQFSLIAGLDHYLIHSEIKCLNISVILLSLT